MYQPYTYTTVSETKVIKKSVAELNLSIYGRYFTEHIFKVVR